MKRLWGLRRVSNAGGLQRSTRVGVVVAVAVTVFLTAVGAATAGGWKAWQLDQDRCWDAASRDTNDNGWWDVIWFDINNDCRWETAVFNRVGHDSFLEALTFDTDRDGRWNVWLADTNQQVGYELIFWDDNGDGGWDRWNYVIRVVPRTMRDAVADVTADLGRSVGPSSDDGLTRLLNTIARINGTATFGEPADYDRDGCADAQDLYPENPNKCR